MKLLVLLTVAVAYAAAADPTWHVLKDDLATILTGIDFPSNNDGFLSGGANGAGSLILHTVDGGKNFTSESHDTEMMYLALACAGPKNCLATGLGLAERIPGSSYTKDGDNWLASDSPHLESAFQDCSALHDKKTFFRYGDWATLHGSFSGVSISHDGGVKFDDMPWPTNWTTVRYGSAISNDFIVLAGGEWPEDPTPPKEDLSAPRLIRKLSMHIHLVEDRVTKKRSMVRAPPAKKVEGSDFKTLIMKSINGGQTFETLYNHTGSYYPNGIQFVTDKIGWFVCEGEDESGAAVAYVMGTTNGKDFTKQLTVANGGLFGVAFHNDKEGWAYGATFAKFGFTANFYHTTDGGSTWTLETLKNHYPYEISLSPGGNSYASAFMVDGNSGVLIYD